MLIVGLGRFSIGDRYTYISKKKKKKLPTDLSSIPVPDILSSGQEYYGETSSIISVGQINEV